MKLSNYQKKKTIAVVATEKEQYDNKSNFRKIGQAQNTFTFGKSYEKLNLHMDVKRFFLSNKREDTTAVLRKLKI